MFLADHQIKALAVAGMIGPFTPEQIRTIDGRPCVSYGLSSVGYDARLSTTFRVFEGWNRMIDPLADRWHEAAPEKVNAPSCVIPPHGFALAHTVERFRMPPDVFAICLGKSTYARCGLIVNVTPLEPGWEGHVTLELVNPTPMPLRVHAGMGICQFLFARVERPTTTYADRAGKYQGQTGITMPKV